MRATIEIIREGMGYRLLHGEMRLAAELSHSTETTVNVIGEGDVKVIRDADGFHIEKDGQRLPLQRT
jgi:hypothetical protein